MTQHYIAGNQIRYKYGDKLVKDISNVEIHSTNTNRTILSAYARTRGIVNDETIPFPVKITQLPTDLSDMANNCFGESTNKIDNSTLAKIRSYVRAFESTIYPSLKHKLNLLLEAPNKRMLLNNPSPKPKKIAPKFLYHIADTIYCAQTDKRDLSYLELSQANLTFIEEFRKFYLYNGKRTIDQDKILAKPYFDFIMTKAHRFLNNTDNIKYVGHAAHDTTLVTLIKVLSIIDPTISQEQVFPFASQMIIEIYANNTLEFIYNNQRILTIEKNILEENLNIILSQPEISCQHGWIDSIYSFEPIFSNIIYFLVSINVLLAIILFSVYRMYNGKNENETKLVSELSFSSKV